MFLDIVKKSITDDTITRDPVLNNAATNQYYHDLLQALSIENFPLVEVNTIAKKTYMIESIQRDQYCLVFDHYLLENLHTLNQIVMDPSGSQRLDAYFYKTMAEECYSINRYDLSIEYACSYLGMIDSVIEEYKKQHSDTSFSDYLFLQQAILIAHELFHFVLSTDKTKYKLGMIAKKDYLNSICSTVNTRDRVAADYIKEAINNSSFIEECLCDSTGIIQAIDVGNSIRSVDIIDTASAAALAIMNQFTLSLIQTFVRQHGILSYSGALNLFNSRLLHFKIFTSEYIKENYSHYKSQQFQSMVECYANQWMQNVHFPILRKLLLRQADFKTESDKTLQNPDVFNRTINLLQQIFNS